MAAMVVIVESLQSKTDLGTQLTNVAVTLVKANHHSVLSIVVQDDIYCVRLADSLAYDALG